MNQSGYQKSNLAAFFFFFLVGGLLFITVKLAENNLTYAWVFVIAMLVLGLPCLVGGVILYGRYKDVFDFEPASLFGRDSNGIKVRKFLLAFIYFGTWATLASIFLFVWLQIGVVEYFVK